jgi:type II secretory pathway pseudopilin PulG
MNRLAATKKQQGVALIATIFLVVIIGALVVLLGTLSLRNTEQTTQSLLQIRAQQAVNSAQEYAVQSLIETDGASCASVLNNATLSIPEYSNYSVQLTCSSTDYNRPSQQITLYQLIATAEYGSVDDTDYVWTKLEATVEF